jgi:hypothetical protein
MRLLRRLHPPPLGRERVTGAGQLLRLEEQFFPAAFHSCGDTIGGVFMA